MLWGIVTDSWIHFALFSSDRVLTPQYGDCFWKDILGVPIRVAQAASASDIRVLF
jgi:hypothetical protein